MSEIIKSNDYDYNTGEHFKEQVSNHIEIINKELDKLTKLLEEKKKEMDFTYKFDISYSNVFEYWKCNLELEHISKLNW